MADAYKITWILVVVEDSIKWEGRNFLPLGGTDLLLELSLRGNDEHNPREHH